MRSFLKFAILLIFLYWLLIKVFQVDKNFNYIDRVENNYGKEVDKICEELDMPAGYFKALIILECKADKNPKGRFEAHVFEQLKNLRDSNRKFGSISRKWVFNKTDSELKALATSWGPLQIMGYHSFYLGVSVEELKGKNSLRYGILWSQQNYGKYLQKKQYRDAFHFHNTGRPHPKWFAQTHDPNYVNKGLAYLSVLDH